MPTPQPPPPPLKFTLRSLAGIGAGMLLAIPVLFALGLLITVTPDWVEWATLAAIVVGGLTLIIRDNYRSQRSAYEDAVKVLAGVPGVRLRDLSSKITTSLQQTAELMDELTRELHAQQVANEELARRSAEQQRMLEVNQEQAEKIQALMAGAAQTVIDANVAAGKRQQWTFFAFGVLVSIPIGVAINLLVP
ncbi:hypothetical protein ACIBH1_45255 [Nonomuraea sp. NPDC050663]|uniref:hypothetical protein n=1 Tax=Nonomuraea sp. NPDC050663 TaxID=3364370 RepID=UPI0037B3575F